MSSKVSSSKKLARMSIENAHIDYTRMIVEMATFDACLTF